MTEPTDRVPVLRCVISAFVFLRRNLAYIYGLGAFYIAANVISTWIVAYYPNSPALSALGTVLSIALIPLVVMLFAAYLRRGLGKTPDSVMIMQLGADELRLFLTMFAVGAITAFIVFLGIMAAFFAVSAVVTSVVDPAVIEAEPTSAFALSGAAGMIATVLAGLGVGALGLYTLARFSPAYPAVIAEGRVVVFEAANWSKGQGWRMALAIILTSLPFYLLLAPGMIQYMQLVMANLPGMTEAGGATPASFDLKPLLWFFILNALVWPASNGAISGLYVTLYRGLRANTSDSS